MQWRALYSALTIAKFVVCSCAITRRTVLAAGLFAEQCADKSSEYSRQTRHSSNASALWTRTRLFCKCLGCTRQPPGRRTTRAKRCADYVTQTAGVLLRLDCEQFLPTRRPSTPQAPEIRKQAAVKTLARNQHVSVSPRQRRAHRVPDHPGKLLLSHTASSSAAVPCVGVHASSWQAAEKLRETDANHGRANDASAAATHSASLAAAALASSTSTALAADAVGDVWRKSDKTTSALAPPKDVTSVARHASRRPASSAVAP